MPDENDVPEHLVGVTDDPDDVPTEHDNPYKDASPVEQPDDGDDEPGDDD